MWRQLSVFLIATMSLTAAVKIEKVPYGGWPNCYRLSNGEVELVVTTDVGPRVIRYGFAGGQNLFAEFKDQMGKSGEKTWTPRGGHRVWVGPEIVPITYALDNGPVQAEVKGGSITLTQPVEPETGLQKQMIVTLAPTGSRVEILHKVKNAGKETRELAPWTLTMMAPGGMGITGFPPRGRHEDVLLPTNPLVMWAFTDLSDKRWTFTKKYAVLRQDRNATEPQKMGLFNPKTFGGYLLGSDLFVKQSTADPKKRYPDFNCSYETYTDKDFLEMETLGPLQKLAPGQTMDHTESWTLHKNVKLAHVTDAELDRIFSGIIK